MYFHDRTHRLVRERAPEDGATPPDLALAEAILDDLRHAPDRDIPVILARFAVVRAWLLGLDPAGGELFEHARSAARGYLDAVPADWPGRPALAALLADAGEDPA